jgi:hypothetical protein
VAAPQSCACAHAVTTKSVLLANMQGDQQLCQPRGEAGPHFCKKVMGVRGLHTSSIQRMGKEVRAGDPQAAELLLTDSAHSSHMCACSAYSQLDTQSVAVLALGASRQAVAP